MPVSVLQIHGTHDTVIRYDGGRQFGVPYPSAQTTVQQWAVRNGCSAEPARPRDRLDLDRSLAGTETAIARNDGCNGNASVELWTIEGGAHVPKLASDFSETVWAWLERHPR